MKHTIRDDLASIEIFGGASRDRTDHLIVANDGVLQKTSLWRALGSRLRTKTVQFKQTRRELPHNFLGWKVQSSMRKSQTWAYSIMQNKLPKRLKRFTTSNFTSGCWVSTPTSSN